MKLTKSKIEELAYEIMIFLIHNEVDDDVLIFYNGKQIRSEKIFETKNYVDKIIIKGIKW